MVFLTLPKSNIIHKEMFWSPEVSTNTYVSPRLYHNNFYNVILDTIEKVYIKAVPYEHNCESI